MIRENFKYRQSGLSLVEIMVAMVAGIILVGAAFQVYLSSKQTYRAQESLARLQENGRFAAMQVRDELRMAGFTGCVSNINNLLASSNVFFDAGRPVFGWEATGTGGGDEYTISGFDPDGIALSQWQDSAGGNLPSELQDLVVPGTDVILVRRADRRMNLTASGNTPANAANINLTGPSGIPQNSIVLVTDCAGADVFQNRNNATSNALNRGAGSGNPGNVVPGSNPFSHQYGSDMEIYTVAIDAYFIGIGYSGRPSLFRLRFGKGTPPASDREELVEGVDNIQWLYGEDTNGDRAVDGYVTAAEVGDWQRVIALRAALLISGGPPTELDSRTTAFSMNGTDIIPPDDRRQRQVFTTTIAMRNRLP